MLNNLLLASLISLGAGAMAPAPLHNKSNLDNTPTTFNLLVNTTSYVQDDTTTKNSRKYRYQNYNDAILIKGNIYTCNLADTYTDGNDFTQDAEDGQNTILYIMQITPYRYLYDTNISVTINFHIQDMVSQYDNYDTIRLNYNVLTSIDDWSEYLDRTNYYIPGNNRVVYNNGLINTENGYIYNQIYDYTDITLNDDDQAELQTQESKTFNITIVNGQTNYLSIYVQPQYIENTNRTTRSITTNKNLLLPTNSFNVNGQMIPPVQNYEVIDLPGTMFYILTMPFTFISTAFNLTLFPGTIYQFNIGNIFLTIIGVLSFMFLIRIFTRNK